MKNRAKEKRSHHLIAEINRHLLSCPGKKSQEKVKEKMLNTYSEGALKETIREKIVEEQE